MRRQVPQGYLGIPGIALKRALAAWPAPGRQRPTQAGHPEGCRSGSVRSPSPSPGAMTRVLLAGRAHARPRRPRGSHAAPLAAAGAVSGTPGPSPPSCEGGGRSLLPGGARRGKGLVRRFGAVPHVDPCGSAWCGGRSAAAGVPCVSPVQVPGRIPEDAVGLCGPGARRWCGHHRRPMRPGPCVPGQPLEAKGRAPGPLRGPAPRRCTAGQRTVVRRPHQGGPLPRRAWVAAPRCRHRGTVAGPSRGPRPW